VLDRSATVERDKLTVLCAPGDLSHSVCVISWELVFVAMRVYVVSVLASVK